MGISQMKGPITHFLPDPHPPRKKKQTQDETVARHQQQTEMNLESTTEFKWLANFLFSLSFTISFFYENKLTGEKVCEK